MPSKHANPQLNVRPPAKLTEEAKKKLEARGLEIRAFVVACLEALNSSPDEFLQRLEPHWPQASPRGRPPTPTADDESGG